MTATRDQVADAWRNLLTGIGHPWLDHLQDISKTSAKYQGTGSSEPTNAEKNFIADQAKKNCVVERPDVARFAFQCVHPQCPERDPVPADHPPTCYTCGERMRATLPSSVR